MPENLEEAQASLEATTRFWRNWLSRARIPDHELRPLIQRSAITIKGLTYMPTGATVAALTTSLPETPGGERNWDYRYTWIRDSTFTLQALHYLNLDWEADEFMQFIADLERNEDGALQIMYGIDGRRDLTESFREDLSGYDGAHPVRLGNGAFDQRQNDVFGAALDSVLLHTRRSKRLPRQLWPLVQSQAECATAVWRQPDQGIWEARGEPQHYVSSKLMCWVGLDRAAKLAAIRGDSSLGDTWTETAAEIKADILEHGLDARGVLRQHYHTDALDASVLLAAIFGFLPATDKRLHATVLAIADELTEDGFVLRYRTDETDDGLSGHEGTFVICSFWLVSALSIVGEAQRARDLMARLAKVASPLGLYAEEFDTSTGRHLGNFPQAFSHLALLEAAARIIMTERLEELGGTEGCRCPLRSIVTSGSHPPRPGQILLPLTGATCLDHRDGWSVDHDGAGEAILEATPPVVVEDRHKAQKQRQGSKEEPYAANQPSAGRNRTAIRTLHLELHRTRSQRLARRGPEDHEVADQPEDVDDGADRSQDRLDSARKVEQRENQGGPDSDDRRDKVDHRRVERERDAAGDKPWIGQVLPRRTCRHHARDRPLQSGHPMVWSGPTGSGLGER